jgi:DNA methylase.
LHACRSTLEDPHPFTGSSTTGLVAYLYQREFIGIDNEKKYLNLSIKRFEDLKIKLNFKKQNLFDNYNFTL